MNKVQELLDPMQFAYRPTRGVEDATATLFNFLSKHLEGNITHIILLFADFSLAFNTIQLLILYHNLVSFFSLDLGMLKWLTDFLIGRPQSVRVNSVLSRKKMTSAGSPQGCVLYPLLFILYTNDCRSHHTDRHFLKFADDTVLQDMI